MFVPAETLGKQHSPNPGQLQAFQVPLFPLPKSFHRWSFTSPLSVPTPHSGGVSDAAPSGYPPLTVEVWVIQPPLGIHLTQWRWEGGLSAAWPHPISHLQRSEYILWDVLEGDMGSATTGPHSKTKGHVRQELGFLLFFNSFQWFGSSQLSSDLSRDRWSPFWPWYPETWLTPRPKSVQVFFPAFLSRAVSF